MGKKIVPQRLKHRRDAMPSSIGNIHVNVIPNAHLHPGERTNAVHYAFGPARSALTSFSIVWSAAD